MLRAFQTATVADTIDGVWHWCTFRVYNGPRGKELVLFTDSGTGIASAKMNENFIHFARAAALQLDIDMPKKIRRVIY
jgi:hypothetical protein